jgi:hypothetical protein
LEPHLSVFFPRLRLPGTTATFGGPFHFVVFLLRIGMKLRAGPVVLASRISTLLPYT